MNKLPEVKRFLKEEGGAELYRPEVRMKWQKGHVPELWLWNSPEEREAVSEAALGSWKPTFIGKLFGLNEREEEEKKSLAIPPVDLKPYTHMGLHHLLQCLGFRRHPPRKDLSTTADSKRSGHLQVRVGFKRACQAPGF